MKCRRLFLLAGLLSSSSCAFLSLEEEVTLICPSPPVAWQIAFPGLGFRVVTGHSRGAAVVTEIAGWRVPSSCRCSRAVNSPIVAWPYEPGNQRSAAFTPGLLRPAGGFFPLSFRASGERQVVELSWEEGPAALVMSRVAGEGRDTSRFNVPRLCRFLGESGEPWSQDLDAAAQKISQGEFTAWDIDQLPCRDAEVEPGPGTWFLESPFSPTFESTGGRLILPHVALGTHRLFSIEGLSWTLEVGEKETMLMPAPPDCPVFAELVHSKPRQRTSPRFRVRGFFESMGPGRCGIS
jgi:hypothetical protein